MRYGPVALRDKRGRAVTLRSAAPGDAEAMLRYLRVTAGETPYLLRNSDEVQMTAEQEAEFLRQREEAPRDLMLLAEVDGQLAGSCAVMSLGRYRRCGHRCGLAIALYREFWGAGVGELLLSAALEEAKALGYEQAELEVVSGNRAAVALYEKLGFIRCGVRPRSIKYDDGSYADEDWMIKLL